MRPIVSTFRKVSTGSDQAQFASDNCWGYDNSQAYFADVTAIVAAAGNGIYELADFVKAGGDININGVSLDVFFDDGVAANNRDVVLFHGNDSNIDSAFDPDFWSNTLDGIDYSGGPAGLVLTVSDGQPFADEEVLFDVNGGPANVLLPGPANFNGLTAQNPNGAAAAMVLWDEYEVPIDA